MFRTYTTTLLLTLALVASDHASASPAQIPTCLGSKLRESEPGFKCRTSQGYVFTRVHREGFNEAWKTPTGLIWGSLQSRLTVTDGTSTAKQPPTRIDRMCNEVQSRLPTSSAAFTALSAGLAEIYPEMTEANAKMMLHDRFFCRDIYYYCDDFQQHHYMNLKDGKPGDIDWSYHYGTLPGEELRNIPRDVLLYCVGPGTPS